MAPFESLEDLPVMDTRAPSDQLEVFLEQLDEPVQDYGAALRRVRGVCQQALDPESLQILTAYTDDSLTDDSRSQRRQLNTATKRMKNKVEVTIATARNAAQGYVIYDDDDLRGHIQDLYSHSKQEGDQDEDIEAKFLGKTWIDVFEAEKSRCEIEKQIRNSLKLFLNLSPENLFLLLERLQKEDFDTDEYRPLLVFLAKNMFDPVEVSNEVDQIGGTLDHLRETPENFQPYFAGLIQADVDSEEDPQTISPESVAWLRFMQHNMSNPRRRFPLSLTRDDTPDGDKSESDLPIREVKIPGRDTPISLPLSISALADWPEPLRKEMQQYYEQYLRAAYAEFEEILAPYKQPSNFYIAPETIEKIFSDYQTSQQGNRPSSKRTGKGAKGNGSRVTPKGSPSQFIVEDEPEEREIGQIGELITLSGIGTPKNSQELAECADVRSVILAIPAVSTYLRQHASDPDIADDLVRMIQSILEEPRGNGALKLTDSKIKFAIGNEQPRQLDVWHLNTNKRSGLSVGDTARQTRIYYVIAKTDAGKKAVLIARVDHKNSAEKIRSKI